MKKNRKIGGLLGSTLTLLAAGGTASAAELPVPCVAGSCGASVTSFVTSGRANVTSTADSMLIRQETDKAILNWKSFNIGPDGKVVFEQPDSTSIALNRVFQNSPSKIFGALQANGQVYLINQNGIVFGKGSQVNTAGLLASTLNMSDAVFSGGVLSASRNAKPVIEGANIAVLDEAGKPVLGPDGKEIGVQIRVEQGAKITTSGVGGRVLLASRNVTNEGTIETPDGQTLLAAGEKVYLAPSNEPSIRGLLIEVDSADLKETRDADGKLVSPGVGSATNAATGVINTPRGNTTIAGYAVNQNGRISATTTVSANGSVRLIARDSTTTQGDGSLQTSRGGKLTVGGTSRIELLPDLDDKATAVDDQEQLASSVEMTGQQVVLKSGSQITANGGKVTFTAMPNPTGGIAGGLYDSQSRIRVESGASIDVSGSSVTLPASRNLVTLELRANELADSPLQRDSAVRGQTVTVDRRVGTKLADISGALKAIPKSIAERTSAGGTVSFNSAGDVVVADNARIDVSGGVVNYEAGILQTTQLMGTDGRLVDIGDADPNAKYIAVINPTSKVKYDRWGVTETVNGFSMGHLEDAYSEGADAGTVSFAAPNMVLNGTFVGTVKTGTYQRDPATAPLGGQFIVGVSGFKDTSGPGSVDLRAPSINLVADRPKIVVDSGASLDGPRDLDLSTDFLTDGGFTRAVLHSNGTVRIEKSNPLQLQAGSSLEIDAARIEVGGNITSLGGSILLNAQRTFGTGVTLPRTGVNVHDGVTLDVSGTWTNDFPVLGGDATPFGVVNRDGGTISISARPDESPTHPSELVLGDDVSLLANGGAWRQGDGTLVGGKGGKISLLADRPSSAFEIGDNVTLKAYGVNGADGGSLSIAATRLEIDSGTVWANAQRIEPMAPVPPLNPPLPDNPQDPLGPRGPLDENEEIRTGALEIGTPLFTDNGFSHFTLSASGQAIPAKEADALVVRDGASIDLRVSTIMLGDAQRTRLSGGTVADFGTATLLPTINRGPADLTLRVAAVDSIIPDHAGRLVVEAGAVLGADPGSSFTFSGENGVFFNGTLNAPSGKVRFATTGPTAPLYEQGYLPDLRLEIGSPARVDTSGIAVIEPSDRDLRIGRVLDGGSISLLAQRGSINVQSGAQFSVAGTSAALDLQLSGDSSILTRTNVASSAGSFELRSGESIAFGGTLDAHAGVGDTGTARAGTFTFALTRANGRGFLPHQNPGVGDPFPTTPSVIRVVDTPIAVGGSTTGQAFISTEQIRATGADALRLESDGAIAFDPNVSLSLGRSLTLDSAAISTPIGGTVNLQAPYVAFGNTVANVTPDPVVEVGGGILNVRGDQIDLFGTTNLLRIGQATFTSKGDLRMQGVGNSDRVGALRTNGDLTLQAARIYGSTGTDFTLSATGGVGEAGNTIRLQQNGSSPGAPLSAASALSVVADNIEQGGSLYAPFGTIKLSATKRLSLLDGSTTSVSAAGLLIPYGRVEIGTDWLYNEGLDVPLDGVPNRRIELNAADLVTEKNSTVDLRGGGDLYAYEWAPGTGGHTDLLDPTKSPGLYAIIPGLAGNYAPYDPQEYANSDLKPGDSIYLSGGGGVPAGTYALLPARYALLPGAYLVTAVKGTQDLQPNARPTQSDGSPIVSGYRTFGTTGIGDTRYTGYSIRPGSFGREIAAYNDYKASTFFPSQAARLDLGRVPLTMDAGSLGISAENSLNARGSVLSAGATGGRAASIDVSATHLELTSATGEATAGLVQLDTGTLASWNASQLLLGGRRSVTEDGESIEVLSDTVKVAPNTSLALDEITIVARDQVSIASGAHVTSRSSSAAQPAKLDKDPVEVTLTGEGASGAVMLAVSDFSKLEVTRSTDAGSALAGPVVPGRVTIAAGGELGSRGSVLLDAPGGASIDGTLNGAGADITLASGHIAFGNESIADGITVNDALAAKLALGSSASFISSGTIDFTRDLAFGSSSLDTIAFNAQSLRNVSTGNNVALTASSIVLGGSAADDAQPVTTGNESGKLTFNADNFLIGPGTLALEGFASEALNARGEIRTDGKTALRATGALDLTAAGITANSETQAEIASNSTLRLLRPESPIALSNPLQLGGELTLLGRDIETSGRIVMPSGLLSMRAENDLTIHSDAVFNVSGALVGAADRIVGSPGGTIMLAAGRNMTAETGSLFALSGAEDEEAGRLTLQAGGVADLGAATYEALSTGAATGGSFTLDANSIVDFGKLNSQLEVGGFTRERNVRTATGDLDLDAGQTITARAVKLVADGGRVNIGGSIVARSDNQRATIDLFGTQGVTLVDGAFLTAEGVGAEGRGGIVTLGTTTGGTLDLQEQTYVSTRGAAENGRVLLRAPALGLDTPLDTTNDDVAITNVGTTFLGVSELAVAPVLAFDAPALVDAGVFQGFADQASQFAGQARNNFLGRVDTFHGALPQFRPDVELRSTGNIDIGGIDLSQWRFVGNDNEFTQPGALTVRAAGSINIIGNISDGFARQGGVNDLMNGGSATLRFTAGAQLASADTGAIVRGASGDLVVGDESRGVIVRTGTGDIQMAAAHDLKILGPTGAGATGSSVYTMGLAGVPADQLENNRQVIWSPTQGGQVSLYAGHDVVGSPVTQSVGAWEIRGGRNSDQTTRWGTRIPQFKWNVGTLGGGDIDIRSGNDVLDLSVAAADSAYEKTEGTLTRFKGGVLTVNAGRDISAIYAHATNGVNRLNAEGSFTRSPNRPLDVSGVDPGASVFSFQDAQYALSARGDIMIETVEHPTMMLQPGSPGPLTSYFTTYSDDSAFSAQSLSGDVVINPRDAAFWLYNGQFGHDSAWASVLPPQVRLHSLSRDVVVNQALTSGALYVAPSDFGQFDLFAARDFLLDSSIYESDAAAQSLPTPLNPTFQPVTSLTELYSGRRVDDDAPSLVTAGRDIVFAGTGASRLTLASSSRISAGRDMVNFALRGQNLNPDDVTSVSAGRDIRYTSDNRTSLIEVGGPGRLDILAGRDVDFGFSQGASTVGGILNPALAKRDGAELDGANLTVLAGLANGMDTMGFITTVVSKTTENKDRFISYVEAETGKKNLNFDSESLDEKGRKQASALDLFKELDPLVQRPFVLETFFRELVLSGREANSDPKLGFSRGYAAIDALFPKSRPTSDKDPPSPYAGDINLAFSKIYTLDGGTISLVAPGGLLNVGLANPPPRLNLNRPPSQLGIVAQGAGDVRIFTNGDVLVNESRVFTLGGGDIAVWSTTGNIDAGRGAKSSISAPAPTTTVDEKGNVVVTFGSAVAGSGIRTIDTPGATKQGDVDLIAPSGTVNAGDAGILASRNLNVAAAQVVGLDNIQVGGTSTGVPAETSSLGATLAGVSAVASSATNSAQSAVENSTRTDAPAPLADTALGWLDVFVEGFGEDVCKASDAACLNNNKPKP